MKNQHKENNLAGDFLEWFCDWFGRHPRQLFALILFIFLGFINIYLALSSYLIYNILLRIFQPNWVIKIVLFSGVLVGCFLSLLNYQSIIYERFSAPKISGLRVFHPSMLEENQGQKQSSLGYLYDELKADNKHLFNAVKNGGFYINSNKNIWFVILFFAGLSSYIFWIFSLVPNNAHERELRRIRKGQQKKSKEISSYRATSKLKNSDCLAVSLKNGKLVDVSNKQLNHILMVVGTTGGGKTVTLTHFYRRAIATGMPLTIIDGKPDDNTIHELARYAQSKGVPFYGFNVANFCKYDFLSDGSPTVIKDKIISLKNESEWSSDHYRSLAEMYLQTAIEVLQATENKLTLSALVDVLDVDELLAKKRNLDNADLCKRIDRVCNVNKDDLKGIQAHLVTLLNSDFGNDLSCDAGFTLAEAMQSGAVVYFALPSLLYPSFAKTLGKLVINDLKTVIANHRPQMMCAFDEFSVFAGDQVLNVVNMGRGFGAHTIFGTQGFADLELSGSPKFKNKLLNCVNTLIVHRVNDVETAEECSAWIGTKQGFSITSQVDLNSGDTGLGSVRDVREFIVHPDDIKQRLGTGEAYFCSKVGGFSFDKIKINYRG
jgi:hypothetical protein